MIARHHMGDFTISLLFVTVFLFIIGQIFVHFQNNCVASSVSLPCFTILTSVIYFFIIPYTLVSDSSSNYLGIYLSDMRWMQFAVLLYIAGMAVACRFFERNLKLNVAEKRVGERIYNPAIYYGLIIISFIGIFYLTFTNKLNLISSSDFTFDKSQINTFSFVNLVFNILIPLMLVFLIKRNFDLLSLFLMLILFWILLQTGFRYRILILAASAGTAFFIANNYRIRTLYTVGGAFVGVFLVNLLGMIRRYGEGVDLSRLENVDVGSILTSFRGEAGIAFVMDYTARQPLPPLVTIEPWTVAIARLVPSFLWADKPQASYLENIVAGATTIRAEQAGAAAPQQVEMLFQFGWPGIPVLAFLYFGFAVLLLGWINRLGREARIAGFAMIPVYFGYYMQTRGYFSQILSDGLFFFLPLFMIHWFDRRSPNGRQIQTSVRTAPRPLPELY